MLLLTRGTIVEAKLVVELLRLMLPLRGVRSKDETGCDFKLDTLALRDN